MLSPRVLTITSRTATVLLPAPGAFFSVPNGIPWSLKDASGRHVSKGTSKTTALFLDGLEPETEYLLSAALGELKFQTAPCAGLIEAHDIGVSPTHANNSDLLARAIAQVPKGGTLRLTAGRYATGPIFLKPHMTLLLDKGAELAAIDTRQGWPQLPAHDEHGRAIGTWEGLPERSFAALVTAIDCKGLSITGQGTIDGGGDRGDWWDWPKETRDDARRPRTLHLLYSDNVSLSGVTIRNSPSWTVHPYRCNGLRVAAVKIQNPPDSPNTDGLNPESCSKVEITGVDFSVGDDCIAIKAGKRGPKQFAHLAPCTDISISHCRMQRGHGAVVLGSEMSGDISGVTIENCEFDRTDRGLRLKTRRGRGGVISGVHLRNVSMSNVATPLAANAFYFCDLDGKDDWVQSRSKALVDHTTPNIRDITLTNVTAQNVSVAALALLGLPEAPITDVQITGFNVSFDPLAKAEIPLMTLGMDPVRHATSLTEFAEVSGEVTEIAVNKEAPAC